MRYRNSIWAAAVATVLLATPSVAQIVDFGKYPNLKGQWVRQGSPNNWRARRPGAAHARIPEDLCRDPQDLKDGGPGNWPSTFCIPAGMPAMMSLY